MICNKKRLYWSLWSSISLYFWLQYYSCSLLLNRNPSLQLWHHYSTANDAKYPSFYPRILFSSTVKSCMCYYCCSQNPFSNIIWHWRKYTYFTRRGFYNSNTWPLLYFGPWYWSQLVYTLKTNLIDTFCNDVNLNWISSTLKSQAYLSGCKSAYFGPYHW